jgi:hypothetical protein
MVPPKSEQNPLFSPLSGQLASFTGIILNVFLFILTLTCTKNQMKDYAKVIRMHCLIDALIDLEIFVAVTVSFRGCYDWEFNSRNKLQKWLIMAEN